MSTLQAVLEEPMPVTVAKVEGDKNRLSVPGINALGSLEAKVMAYIWSRGPSTVHQVYMYLRQEADKSGAEEYKYTTILNTLHNLTLKGLLESAQAEGTNRTLFVYTPIINPTQYAHHVVFSTMAVLDAFAPEEVDAYLAQRTR